MHGLDTYLHTYAYTHSFMCTYIHACMNDKRVVMMLTLVRFVGSTVPYSFILKPTSTYNLKQTFDEPR